MSISPRLGTGILHSAVATLKSPAGLRIAGFFPIAFIALAPPTSAPLSQLQLLVLTAVIITIF